jgi:hypothetical protein
MLAVCYEKSDKKLVIRQGREKVHELVDGSKTVELVPEVHVQFDLVPERGTEDVFEDPSFMPGGETPRRAIAKVRGTLGIEQAAEKAGLAPEDLVFWMLHHPAYDTAVGFIIRRDDGKKVLDLDDWVLDAPNGYDSKDRYCRCCEKELDARGKVQHFKSDGHIAALRDYSSRLKQRLALLGRESKASDSVAYL